MLKEILLSLLSQEVNGEHKKTFQWRPMIGHLKLEETTNEVGQKIYILLGRNVMKFI